MWWLARLFIIQTVPTLVVNDPRRHNRSPRPQRVPRIQEELGNAQVVWDIRTVAMDGMELVDCGNRRCYARHFGVRPLDLGGTRSMDCARSDTLDEEEDRQVPLNFTPALAPYNSAIFAWIRVLQKSLASGISRPDLVHCIIHHAPYITRCSRFNVQRQRPLEAHQPIQGPRTSRRTFSFNRDDLN